MTNKQTFLITAALTCGLTVSTALGADIAANTARMQAMDKITGRVSEIDVPVGGITNFGTFSILVRKCVTKSPEETPENTAFVDIVDNYRTSEPVNIFKGWMFSSSPALNAVEHPIYDVWLLKCYDRPQSRGNLLTEQQLELRDTIPMQRLKKKASLTEPVENRLELPDDTDDDDITTSPSEASPAPNTENYTINVDETDTSASPAETEDNFIVEDDMIPEIEQILDLPQMVPTENPPVSTPEVTEE